jgi:hypothetical protein
MHVCLRHCRPSASLKRKAPTRRQQQYPVKAVEDFVSRLVQNGDHSKLTFSGCLLKSGNNAKPRRGVEARRWFVEDKHYWDQSTNKTKNNPKKDEQK